MNLSIEQENPVAWFSFGELRCPKCGRRHTAPKQQNPGSFEWGCADCGHRSTTQLVFASDPLCENEPSGARPGKAEMDHSGDPEAAIEQCDRILGMCDEVPERGEEFADSVREKVESIRDWIDSNACVTEAQQKSLDNMEHGVSRWIH